MMDDGIESRQGAPGCAGFMPLHTIRLVRVWLLDLLRHAPCWLRLIGYVAFVYAYCCSDHKHGLQLHVRGCVGVLSN